MLKKFFLIISATLIVCCASQSQVLINPITKNTVNCSTWGFGWIGAPIAIISYHKCVNSYKALGYITIEESAATQST
jgi:hypothetical protein